MGNDMRLVKFGMMIGDIFEDLGNKGLYGELSSIGSGDCGGYETSWLSVMYDYDKLNEYGKAIIDQVSSSSMFIYDGSRRYMDINMQMEAAKEVVKVLKSGKTPKAFYGVYPSEKDELKKLHLLFWALMVLAVDDMDKEDHLSMICGCAKSLSVSDDEMMDLVRIIRVFYNVEGDNEIQTGRVKKEFKKVIEKYGIATAGDESLEADEGLMGGIMGSFFRSF